MQGKTLNYIKDKNQKKQNGNTLPPSYTAYNIKQQKWTNTAQEDMGKPKKNKKKVIKSTNVVVSLDDKDINLHIIFKDKADNIVDTIDAKVNKIKVGEQEIKSIEIIRQGEEEKGIENMEQRKNNEKEKEKEVRKDENKEVDTEKENKDKDSEKEQNKGIENEGKDIEGEGKDIENNLGKEKTDEETEWMIEIPIEMITSEEEEEDEDEYKVTICRPTNMKRYRALFLNSTDEEKDTGRRRDRGRKGRRKEGERRRLDGRIYYRAIQFR